MPRVKESLTIDEDLSKWLRSKTEFKSSSEFVNQVLRDYMCKENDIYSELYNVEVEISKLYEKREQYLKEIEQILEEGNKQEREKAETVLLKQREREKAIIRRVEKAISILKELGLLQEALDCDTLDKQKVFIKKNFEHIFQKGINVVDSSVGLVDLQMIIKNKDRFKVSVLENATP